jgi:DNA-binding CsgD family transcriptional regulator
MAGLERLLGTAQELAQMGSWEMDLRSGGTVWSDQMYRVVGLEPGDGKRTQEEILEFVHPDDRERIGALLTSAMDHPEAVPAEGVTGTLRGLRADGSTRDWRAYAAIARDERGEPVRWIGVLQDVTEERLGERELQAHYALSEALREWESFESGVMDLLGGVGTALGYEMGSMWLWDDGRDALSCRAFWHADEVDPGFFEYEKRRLNFKPGEGKPGRAWQTLAPVVTADAATDPLFQPREAALQRGVASGLAWPAVGPDGPLAVLSYYSFDHRVPSNSIVRTLTTLGRELGAFLSHRRVELGSNPLTGRELEVLRLAAEGNPGPQIAEHLYISPATVKTHFDNIYEKLGVSDRGAAVAQALRIGVIR